MNANQEQKTSIKKVSSEYTPYLALALCWKDQRQTGLFYDKVPASFARHPCDLFKEGEDNEVKREVWKPLERYDKEKINFLLPNDAPYLWHYIAGGLEVSSFGRVGIPINNESSKDCKKCALKNECKRFHFILPQYEECLWDDSKEKFDKYNGYLVVDINGRKECVYHLVAEAFKMKEETFQKMKEGNKKEGNKDFIDYIKEKCGYGDEENLKKAFENADELQIHHINNNGHHNTPTYWEKGRMIKGNLIALPKSVHQNL